MTQSKHYQQLTPEERVYIESSLNARKSQVDIARLIKRSRSIISRELKRGTLQHRHSDTHFFTK